MEMENHAGFRNVFVHALTICLLLGSPLLASRAQSPPAPTASAQRLDTFYMKNGKKKLYECIRLAGDSIYYRYPKQSTTYHMNRNRVIKIAHSNGETQDIQKAPTPAGSRPVRWQDVTITREKTDVRGMRLLDKYDEKLGSSNIHRRVKASKLEKAAIIQLQKRAALKRATHLYIEEVKFATAFGEPPSVHIKAAAYRKLSLPKGYKPQAR